MPASRSRQPRHHPQEAGCLSVLALALFFCAGLLIFSEFFLDPLRNVLQALRWDPVPCTILVSRVEQAPWKASGTGTRAPGRERPSGVFRPEVLYRYAYNGKVYTSNRIWFIKPERDTRQDIQAFVDRFPVGSRHRCYVDPADPGFSVLQRGFKPVLLIAVVPIAMMLTGLAGLSTAALQRLRPSRPYRTDVRYRPTLRPLSSRRPLVLHPLRRGPGLATALLLAVGWNFSVFFLAREVVRDWVAGFPGCYGLLLSVCALVLVVAGVVLAVIPVLMILRRISPRPVVTIDSLKAEAGREVAVSWVLRGRRRWLRRLTVILEGREEATYVRDDQLLTDAEVFYSQTLLSSPRGEGAYRGTLRLAAPSDLPPSFWSPHNGILWIVRFHIELARWPNIDDEFELTVLPAGGGRAHG